MFRSILFLTIISHHHHHLPPWIRSFDLFLHRRVGIVSWGVRDSFFPGVCRWGHISGVWCCPFFRGGWSSFVCIWVSRLVFQRSIVLVLCLRFLFCLVWIKLWEKTTRYSMISVGVSRGQLQHRNTSRLFPRAYDTPLKPPAIMANFMKS